MYFFRKSGGKTHNIFLPPDVQHDDLDDGDDDGEEGDGEDGDADAAVALAELGGRATGLHWREERTFF